MIRNFDDDEKRNAAADERARNADFLSDNSWRAAFDLFFKFFNVHDRPEKLKDAWDILKDLKDYFDILNPDPTPTPINGCWSFALARSSDPNDKLGPSGYGSAAYLPADGTLAYQIRFENQPSATAPAQHVVVTDMLDPNLDLSTFELTEIAFGNQVLAIPPGLNHYQKSLAFIVTNQTLIPLGDGASALALLPSNAILVEVDAHLDMPTRLLTLTLTAIDPNTGWYPEDPLIGLLYPNDGTGRGDGSISYIVRANSGAASGTRVENRARIVFDYNDPIDTPLVFNTLDAAAPVSAVAPLPAEAGPTFLVQWSGQDDPGGSGLASFDICVTENGTNRFLWLSQTTATSAWFRGEPGHTYAFTSLARDNVGQEEPLPAAPQAVTTVPATAPVLSSVLDSTTLPGATVTFTNAVLGTPSGEWRFSLGAGAPSGVVVDPTNGVFRWNPACSQASRSYAITVWVADTGRPNLMDARVFTIVVGECVVPSLGRLVLEVGNRGRVPVNLISTVPLTSLSMTVEAPTDRLTDFTLEPVTPGICESSITVLTDSLQSLSMRMCANQWLIGTQQVAWLYFTAVSNESSAFVDLLLDNTVGLTTDGNQVANFAPQSGRVVIISEEPLLEAVLDADQSPALVLYGRPGWDCEVHSCASLDPAAPWQEELRTTQPDLYQTFDVTLGASAARYFRAVRRSR